MRLLTTLLGQAACSQAGGEDAIGGSKQQHDPASRVGIAYGKLLPQDEVPAWMGGLYVAGTGDGCGAVCGGALISPGVFLLAAHCIYETDAGLLHTLKQPLDTFRVALQEAYVPTPEECSAGHPKPIPSERVYKIKSAHRHCDWSNNPDISDKFLYKDIAVLYLDRCADAKTPLIAGRGFNDHAGMETLVYGWGEDEKHVESSYLKVGNMTVATVGTTDQDCGHQKGKTHPGVMCVDLEKNKAPGARSGDSGGPVMVDNTHVGIVSGGDGKNAQLARTAYYQTFLEVVLRHDTCRTPGNEKALFDSYCEADCGEMAAASYYPPLMVVDKNITACKLPDSASSMPATAVVV